MSLSKMSLVVCSCVLFALLPSIALGQDLPLEIPLGKTFAAPKLEPHAERFELPEQVVAALTAADLGERISFSAFPVAPGVRQPVIFERYDVYAPHARIYVVDEDGERQIPRSRRLHFLGSVPDDPITRVGFSIDPASGELSGIIDSPFGDLRLRQEDPASYRLELVDAAAQRAGATLETQCGLEELPSVGVEEPGPPPVGSPRVTRVRGVAGAPSHSAVIAVDTDNELLDQKFGNNTTAANNWLANLFTEMNVAYERDVGLRLLLGDVFLRPGSTPYESDPWGTSGTVASNSILNEFGSYWSLNMVGVERVLAMKLSGRSSSFYSASGIAWLDGFCEKQSVGGGYSVTHVFKANFSSANIIAHELGHNFGSPHTHCYSPPVDTCYRAEPGCYSGAVSCPGGPGSIMSYCHFSAPNGAACGRANLEFHPTVIGLFDSFIANHTPGCVQLLAGDLIFSDGFESGNTSAW